MVEFAAVEPGHGRSFALRSGRSDALDSWLAGTQSNQAFCEQHGLLTGQFYAVALYRVNRIGASSTLDSALTPLLQAELARRRIAAPIIAYRDMAVLFVPVEKPEQTQRLKWLTEDLRAKLMGRVPGGNICCGVGRAVMSPGLRQSFNDAREALDLCSTIHDGARPTFFGDSSLYQLLKALGDSERLTHFCAVWLATLIEYDDHQHSDLLETLQVYFDNNGNTARTAAQLRIHRNTLAYRLNRIAAITQLDLEDADVRLNLQLALKARQMLGIVAASV